MFPYIVLVGVVIALAGALSYVIDTIKGASKPNRVTWLMWSVAPLIATAAGIASGVGWAAVPVFMSGFGPLLVFLATFVNRNSYWKLDRVDYLCGLLSLLALMLWRISSQPNIAIAFAIASDGTAAVPTLIKAWRYPESESLTPYLTGLLNAVTSFFAIKAWKFASYAFPLYLVIVTASLILIITRGRTGRSRTICLCGERTS